MQILKFHIPEYTSINILLLGKNMRKTTYFKEFSKETEEADIPYYPKRLTEDMEKLALYEEEVKKMDKIYFVGRLATYRYMDMHHVIGEALDLIKKLK
jgi:UDP-galactopyranose mutase